MMRQLQAGRSPIVQVRENGLTPFHYVLIIGAENGSYLCIDPLHGQRMPLARYGNRVYEILYVDRLKRDIKHRPPSPKNSDK